MHDPSHLAFGIKRFIDVWHDEPEGRDAGTVCGYAPHNGIMRWRYLIAHRHHMRVNVLPYQRVDRWLHMRCNLCGFRFHWKQARFGYMSSDKVWHEHCMAYESVKRQRDEAWDFIVDPGAMDETARWRVGYAIDHRLGLKV